MLARTRWLAAFQHAAASSAMPVPISPASKSGRDLTRLSTPPTAEAHPGPPLHFVTGEIVKEPRLGLTPRRDSNSWAGAMRDMGERRPRWDTSFTAQHETGDESALPRRYHMIDRHRPRLVAVVSDLDGTALRSDGTLSPLTVSRPPSSVYDDPFLRSE